MGIKTDGFICSTGLDFPGKEGLEARIEYKVNGRAYFIEIGLT